MTLTQLYKYSAKIPFIAERKKAELTLKLQELREEYIKSNDIRKSEIKKEANEIKEYLSIFTGKPNMR